MKILSHKTFLLVLILIILGTESHAQLSVGVRGGVNFSKFKVKDDIFPYASKTGSSFAFLLNIPLNPFLSLQLEPGFSQYGTRYDITEEININNLTKNHFIGKLSTNYIELPLLLQYKTQIRKLQAMVSIGPELRFRAGSTKLSQSTKRWQNDVLISDVYIRQPIHPDNAYRHIDYGLGAGIGIAYPVGPIKVFAEGRYHLGLRKLNPDWVTAFNRAASVNLGLSVPLKK